MAGNDCLHTTSLTLAGNNFFHPCIRIYLRPMSCRPGQIGHQHGLFALGLAARQAMSGEATLANIALKRFHRPAQSIGTSANQTTMPGNFMLTVIVNGQVLFHFVEIRRQFVNGEFTQTEIPLPVLQNKVRGSETDTAVDYRGASHTGPLKHQQIAVAVTLTAMILIEGVQAVGEILGEVLGGHIRTCLQHQHFHSPFGQLIGADCPTSPRPDDHHIGFQLQMVTGNITGLVDSQAGSLPFHFAHARASPSATLSGSGALPRYSSPHLSLTGPSNSVGGQVAESCQ